MESHSEPDSIIRPSWRSWLSWRTWSHPGAGTRRAWTVNSAVAAFVVSSGAASADHGDLASELRGALGGLARFKHPKHYVLVDELPRNAMGKVVKAELRRSHANLFTA